MNQVKCPNIYILLHITLDISIFQFLCIKSIFITSKKHMPIVINDRECWEHISCSTRYYYSFLIKYITSKLCLRYSWVASQINVMLAQIFSRRKLCNIGGTNYPDKDNIEYSSYKICVACLEVWVVGKAYTYSRWLDLQY